MDRLFRSELLRALDEGTPFAMGILSRVKGSSPQKLGAKALFFRDGRIVGTMGGGCLEAEVRERARHSLVTGVPVRFELLLDHDFGWDDGLICGGKVEVLVLPHAPGASELWRKLAAREEAVNWGVGGDFEITGFNPGAPKGGEWLYQENVLPPVVLWLGGAGHVSQAVARQAALLDFAVTVFDDRPALANSSLFPPECSLRVGPWEDLLAESIPPRTVFGLVLTRGHNHDALVLSRWIRQPFDFLGMIGSRRKRRLIFDGLVEEGIATRERVEEVQCPVGMDIRSVSVNEIAVSIAGQLIQRRAELLSPGFLKRQADPDNRTPAIAVNG